MLDELGELLSMPRKALWSALPGLSDPATGQARTGAQVAQAAFGLDPEGLPGRALGFGLEVAGDPLPLLAGGLTKLGQGALKAMKGGGEIAPMLKARRGFTMVKDYAPGGSSYRAVGGGGLAPGTADMNHWLDAMDRVMPEVGASAGFDRATMTGLTRPGAHPAVGRHERVHGLIESAAASGDLSGLPPLSRLAAGLKRTPFDFTRGLGEAANEAAAFAQMQRGAGNQFRNLAGLMSDPGGVYYDQVARISPLAAELTFGLPRLAGMGLLGGGAAAAATPYFLE